MEDLAGAARGSEPANGGHSRSGLPPPSPSGWAPKTLSVEAASPNPPQRTSEVGSAGTLGSLASGAASRAGVPKYRSPSGTRTVTSPGDIRASYESALLQNIRRQVHEFEDRVSRQVQRIEQGLAAVTKAQSAPKMDETHVEAPVQRKVAELSGTVKGLTEEMQSQIGKIQRMEAQTLAAQHAFQQQIQSDLRGKIGELEGELHKVTKSVKTAALDAEDNHKKLASKLLRLERDLVDHLPSNEDYDSMARLSALEQRFVQKEEPPSPIAPSEGRVSALQQTPDAEGFDSTQLVVLDGRLKDVSSRLETVFQEMKEMHSQLGQQQVEISSVRRFAERNQDQAQLQVARFEKISSLECELQRMQQALQRGTEQALEHENRLKLACDRIDRHDELFEGRSDTGTPRKIEDGGDVLGKEALNEAIEEFNRQLKALEERVEAGASRCSMLDGKVGSCDASLKDLGGEVVELKGTVGQCRDGTTVLQGKVDALAVQVEGMGEESSREAEGRAALQATVKSLAQEVQEHGEKLSEASAAMQGALARGGRVTGRVDDLEAQTSNASERLHALQIEVEALRELCNTSSKSENERGEADIKKLQEDVAALSSQFETAQRAAREEQEALDLIREGTARASDVASNAADLAKELRLEMDTLKESGVGHGRDVTVSTSSADDKPADQETLKKLADLAEKLEELGKRFDAGQSCRESLEAEVATLKGKLDLEGPSAAELEKALQEVKEDEEAEQESHKRLLQRIDDVCLRLEEVDQSVSNMAKETPGPLPEEFKKKFETLVVQVEAMRETEGQIKGRMEDLVRRLLPEPAAEKAKGGLESPLASE